jgi:hypothetical protein
MSDLKADTQRLCECATRRARLTLPSEERLAARAARIDAKWQMSSAAVSSEEVKAAQRAAMTRVEVVETWRPTTARAIRTG